MFDISFCRCENSDTCKCPDDKKPNQQQLIFLIDQRSCRRKTVLFLKKNKTKFSTICHNPSSNSKLSKKSSKWTVTETDTEESNTATLSESGETEFLSSNIDDEKDFFTHKSVKIVKQNTVKLKLLPLIADRYGISNEIAAAIASATLVDYGIVNESDTKNLIDSSKVQRARKKLRKKQLEKLKNNGIEALFFDGRKDITKTNEVKRLISESIEHISLVSYPGSFYTGHVSVSNGNALGIFQEIIDNFNQNSISIKNMQAIGCGGAATNTGIHAGVIRQFEKHLKKPLQWLICLIHSNELPLKALMKKIDGPTKGPYSKFYLVNYNY